MAIFKLEDIIRCPKCKGELVDNFCQNCVLHFKNKNYIYFEPTDRWQSWNILQNNANLTYQNDPENNLSVKDRQDSKAFADFCNLSGIILDIGCGPLPLPSYARVAVGSNYVGIDPFENKTNIFPFLRAVSEYLPFKESIFDMVIFGTSFPHLAETDKSLNEVKRVLKSDGSVLLWQGIKKNGFLNKFLSRFHYQSTKKRLFEPGELAIPKYAVDWFRFVNPNEKDILNIFKYSGFVPVRRHVLLINPVAYNLFVEFKLSK